MNISLYIHTLTQTPRKTCDFVKNLTTTLIINTYNTHNLFDFHVILYSIIK